MNTDEVIAIAKTLSPGVEWIQLEIRQILNSCGNIKPFYELTFDAKYVNGHSWEEALRNAGWKG